MKKNNFTILLLIILSIILINNPILAQNNNEKELEWRKELIKASKKMKKAKDKYNMKVHRLGTMITTYPVNGARINTGLFIKPQLGKIKESTGSIFFSTELIYLRKNDEFAGFLSVEFMGKRNVYFGLGTEVIGDANYQTYLGWEPTNNFFIEFKAINTEGGFSESKVYPAAGFQMRF